MENYLTALMCSSYATLTLAVFVHIVAQLQATVEFYRMSGNSNNLLKVC